MLNSILFASKSNLTTIGETMMARFQITKNILPRNIQILLLEELHSLETDKRLKVFSYYYQKYLFSIGIFIS